MKATRLGLWSSALLAICLHAQGLSAQPPPPGETDEATKIARAKVLFESGSKAYEGREFTQALELFARSRDVIASVPNTRSVAQCLFLLNRLDEAQEMYEELLTRFGDQLNESARTAVVTRMEEIHGRLASLDVAANVDGIVVIDGRQRGKLPLVAPIHALPGRHVVRVLKDGYETFEREVSIGVGETLSLDARLNLVGRSGKLRVTGAAALTGADLYVDGGVVGQLPWDGSLAPGPHVIFVRRGDLGSAPREVTLVEGQAVRTTEDAAPLGPDVRILVSSATASLLIDGVRVGRGSWRGRLPVGDHTIKATDEGHVTLVETLTAGLDDGQFERKLQVKQQRSRWLTEKTGTPWLDVLGGSALSPSMQSTAEATCSAGGCSVGRGLLVGLRGGYEFRNGLSIEAGGGYLRLTKSVLREKQSAFGPGDLQVATYLAHDQVRISGPFFSIGAGYHVELGPVVGLSAHTHLVGLVAGTQDIMHVSASAGGTSADATVASSGGVSRAFALLVMPSAEVTFALGPFHTAVGLALGLQLLDGPLNTNGEVVVARGEALCHSYPAPVQCAPGARLFANERTYGPFAVWVPNVALGYRF
jgi:hypothetical protein